MDSNGAKTDRSIPIARSGSEEYRISRQNNQDRPSATTTVLSKKSNGRQPSTLDFTHTYAVPRGTIPGESVRNLYNIVEKRSPRKTGNTTSIYSFRNRQPSIGTGSVTKAPKKIPLASPRERLYRNDLLRDFVRDRDPVNSDDEDSNNNLALPPKKVSHWTLPCRKVPEFSVNKSVPASPYHETDMHQTPNDSSTTSVPGTSRTSSTSTGVSNSRDIIERMIAYSRANGGKQRVVPSTQFSRTIASESASTSASTSDKSSTSKEAINVQRVEPNPTTLAPSPLLKDAKFMGPFKQAGVNRPGPSININTNDSRTSKLRSALQSSFPIMRDQKLTFQKPDRQADSPSPGVGVAQITHSTHPTSFPIPGSTTPPAKVRSTTGVPVIDGSHFTPFNFRRNNSKTEEKVAQSLTPASGGESGVDHHEEANQDIQPTEESVESKESGSTKAAVNEQDMASQTWREVDWRNFSVAMRDTLAEHEMSYDTMITLLSDLKSRLPPEMHEIPLGEVIRRLKVWVISTQSYRARSANTRY